MVRKAYLPKCPDGHEMYKMRYFLSKKDSSISYGIEGYRYCPPCKKIYETS